MPAIGEELGETVHGFTGGRIELSGLGHGAARSRNLEQSAGCGGRKQDSPVLTPSAAPSGRSVRDFDRRPPGKIDTLQFPDCEKTDGAAVRRPEGKLRIFCTRQLAMRERVQGTNPE